MLTGLAVAIALVTAVLNISRQMQVEVDEKLSMYGPNIIVVPESLDLALSFGGIPVTRVSSESINLQESDADLISSIRLKERIRGISPKLIEIAEIQGKKRIVAGVRFRDELKMRPWWRIQGETPKYSRDLILGSDLASELAKNFGDNLTLKGQSFRVVGILDKQMSQEDQLIFADLRELGLLFQDAGKVTLIEVAGWCSACPVELIGKQIKEKLPHARVMAVKQIVEAEIATVRLARRFSLALATIVISVAALFILTTTLASVNERKRELGLFRALGFRRSAIARLILMEGIMITLVSGVLGTIAGNLLALLLARPLANLESLSLNPAISLGALLMGIMAGTLPSLYPAWKATKIDPVAALLTI